jgi:predicted MFS family arabinose efflux permease
MNLIGPHDVWMAALVQLASGFFVGAATAELQVVAFMTIDKTDTGGASTLFNVQRQVGSALGVAITASVLAASGPGLGSYHWAMLTSAGFAIIGVLLALRVTESVVLQREPVPAGR